MATQATEMSVNSVGTEFDAAHANCCVSCCKPCRICLAPISQKCRTDHLFFRLHGMPWKAAGPAQPSGAGKLSASSFSSACPSCGSYCTASSSAAAATASPPARAASCPSDFI